MKIMNIMNPIRSESPLTVRSGAPIMVIADSDFLLGGGHHVEDSFKTEIGETRSI